MVDYLYRAVFIKSELSIYILARRPFIVSISLRTIGRKTIKLYVLKVDIVRYYFQSFLHRGFCSFALLCFIIRFALF